MSIRQALIAIGVVAGMLTVGSARLSAAPWQEEDSQDSSEATQGEGEGQQASPRREPRRGMDRQRRQRQEGGREMRKIMQQLLELSPEEQQELLASNPTFQNIPSHVQERIRQHLERFNALPAEKKQALRDRMASRDGRREKGNRENRRRGPGRKLFLQLAPLSPEEQESFLESDQNFLSLPPKFQQQFRQHLARFNQLSPEEREQQIDRMSSMERLPAEQRRRMERRGRRFSGLTTEQRQQARQAFEAWRQLPVDRRVLMRERLQLLRHASPEEREALLESPKFFEPLQPEEQEILRALIRLRGAMPALDAPGGHSRRPR